MTMEQDMIQDKHDEVARLKRGRVWRLRVSCASLIGAAMLGSLLVLAGCGDNWTSIDDTAQPPELNTYTYGPACIVSSLIMQTDDSIAFDLDGDGTPDNSLAGLARAFNPPVADDIEYGRISFGFEHHQAAGASTAELRMYPLADSDDPPHPADDYSGTESFYIACDAQDPTSCQPTGTFAVDFEDGQFSGEADSIAIPLGIIGNMRLVNVKMAGTYSSSPSGLAIEPSRLGTVLTACDASRTRSPVLPDILSTITDIFNIQPDIDRDGDGLEVISDYISVNPRCVDGDGTEISTPDCACDPRVSDGFSVSLLFSCVEARLLGPNPL